MCLQIKPEEGVVKDWYENQKVRFHEGDSGIDLFIVNEQIIKPGETACIPLGIRTCAISSNTCPATTSTQSNGSSRNVSWLLFPRSSIYKTPLRLCNSVGVIDAGYRGEIIATVDNVKDYTYTVKPGERYFQAVAFNGLPMSTEVVEELDFSNTSRGTGGFGSTNTNTRLSNMPTNK